jgi:hypothetical protein
VEGGERGGKGVKRGGACALSWRKRAATWVDKRLVLPLGAGVVCVCVCAVCVCVDFHALYVCICVCVVGGRGSTDRHCDRKSCHAIRGGGRRDRRWRSRARRRSAALSQAGSIGCVCSLHSARAASLAFSPPPACAARSQIDEARRREQADKLAALSALERQAGEILGHKRAMASLQSRIAGMQSQLLVGGHKLEDTPQFRWVGAGGGGRHAEPAAGGRSWLGRGLRC